ncbi:13302_t:CDS:2, partial [Racocetra persica]
MCFSAAKWKREHVKDHKFDFIDVDSFEEHTCSSWIGYFFVMLMILKSVLVHIADIWTAGILLIFDHWSNSIQPPIPFSVSKWIFVTCIFMSFALLLWEIKKARFIRKTRDISFAFTNGIAYKLYILTGHSYYCFFSKINNSRKCTDKIAFFVFFAFKGWKRLLLAEAPRQAISAITLYSFASLSKLKKYYDITSYGDDTVQRLVVVLMAFSLFIFIFSAFKLIIAALLYIPLIFIIRVINDLFRIGELLEKEQIYDSDPSLPPYARSSALPYSDNFIPSTDMTRSNSPDPMTVGPPPYASKTGTPNYAQSSAAPNYGQPHQNPLYRSNTTDYSNQLHPNDIPPHLNSEMSYNNSGQNQHDPIIAPQQPYPPNPSQPNFSPMNHSNVISPERFGNNLGPVSEPIPVIRQNQQNPIIHPIIPPQATSQPILSDMGHPRQHYPNHGSPQPSPFPPNRSNETALERPYNNLAAVPEPIPFIKQNQQDPAISQLPINKSNITAPERSYNNFNNFAAVSEPISFARQNQHDPMITSHATSQPIMHLQQPYHNGSPQPFSMNRSNVPVTRQNQYEQIIEERSINNSGYVPKFSNEVHETDGDGDRNSYSPYIGYYQNT